MDSINIKDVVSIGATDIGEIVITLNNGETYYVEGNTQVKKGKIICQLDSFGVGFYQRDLKGDYIKPM